MFLTATLVSSEDWNQPPSWSFPSTYTSALESESARVRGQRSARGRTHSGKVSAVNRKLRPGVSQVFPGRLQLEPGREEAATVSTRRRLNMPGGEGGEDEVKRRRSPHAASEPPQRRTGSVNSQTGSGTCQSRQEKGSGAAAAAAVQQPDSRGRRSGAGSQLRWDSGSSAPPSVSSEDEIVAD